MEPEKQSRKNVASIPKGRYPESFRFHKPEAQTVAPATTPTLVYRNGPLITSVEVFTVFWGSGWQATAGGRNPRADEPVF